MSQLSILKNLVSDAVQDFMLNNPDQSLDKEWEYTTSEEENGIECDIFIKLVPGCKFERYGQAQVLHPRFGSWVANLTGSYKLNVGKLTQRFSIEQLKGFGSSPWEAA